MTLDETHDFLERRWNYLVACAMPASLCRSDAEDVAQMVAELMLRHHAKLDADRVAQWLYVVAIREAVRLRKKRTRLSEYVDAIGDRTDDHQADDAIIRATAAQALATLKPDERAALSDQAVGLSYAEIQCQRGWTRRKVLRCIYEGRIALRLAVAA